MAAPSLRGSWAKVDRARENLHSLEEGTDAFLKRHPHYMAVDDDPKTGWNTVIMRSERIPARLSAVAGDVLHDLRSALDHLVWELVRVEGSEPGRHNQFPIYRDEGDFRRDVSERAANRGPGPLAGLDPTGAVWASIERHQPYRRREPEKTHLDLIRVFSNIDKHQTILPGLSILEAVDLSEVIVWNPEAVILEQHFHVATGEPLEARTELARLRFDPGGPEPQVNVNRHLFLDITFGDGVRQGAIVEFDGMRVAVSDLLTEFEQFFQPGS